MESEVIKALFVYLEQNALLLFDWLCELTQRFKLGLCM